MIKGAGKSCAIIEN